MTTVTTDRQSFSRRMVAMTRRGALRGIGSIAAFTLVSGARSGLVAAQEASPAAVPPLLSEWAAVWSSDPAQVETIYAPDAVLEDVATGVVYNGSDGVAAHVAEIRAGLPDAVYTVSSGFVAGDRAALEYVFSGAYTGQLPGLSAGAGQPISARGAALFELADGSIVRESHYYDAYGFLIQLGVLPAPGAATPAP
jgi:steroid delta-isomerase-like uncharacterized protein